MKIIVFILMLPPFNLLAQNVTSVPATDFAKRMDSAGVQLLDVRKPDEYKAGHLEGAFQADWLNKQQFEERVQHLDKQKPVYVYCLAGSRSASAASWLAEKGFTTIVNMAGGINAWKKEGLPLEAQTNTAQMKEHQYNDLVKSSPLVLVDFGAEWCIPCKKMEPIVERFRKQQPAVKLVHIDASAEEEIIKKKNVEGLPVFILYKKGKEVWRKEGITTLDEFELAVKANQ